MRVQDLPVSQKFQQLAAIVTSRHFQVSPVFIFSNCFTESHPCIESYLELERARARRLRLTIRLTVIKSTNQKYLDLKFAKALKSL